MYPHFFLHFAFQSYKASFISSTLCVGCTLTSYPSASPPSRCRMRKWPLSVGEGAEESQWEKEQVREERGHAWEKEKLQKEER